MSEFIAFCAGIVVGGVLGVIIMGLVIGSKISRGGEE